jgi:hypothetical protein
MLVEGTLVGGGGLVADERRPGIEGERLEAGVDNRTILGGAAHHPRPHIEARLEGRQEFPVFPRISESVSVHD